MSNRALFPIAGVLLIAAAGLLWWRPSPPPQPPQPVAPSAALEKPQSGTTPPPPREIVLLPVAETAATLHSDETTAEDDVATLDFLLATFRRHHSGNPVGDNAEIMETLLGGNDRGLAYLDRDRLRLDEQGRLLDRWGHPYFFHAESGERMEIRSPGPDGDLWTEDDVVHDPGS